MFLVRDGSTYRRADSGYSHLGGINGSVESLVLNPFHACGFGCVTVLTRFDCAERCLLSESLCFSRCHLPIKKRSPRVLLLRRP